MKVKCRSPAMDVVTERWWWGRNFQISVSCWWSMNSSIQILNFNNFMLIEAAQEKFITLSWLQQQFITIIVLFNSFWNWSAFLQQNMQLTGLFAFWIWLFVSDQFFMSKFQLWKVSSKFRYTSTNLNNVLYVYDNVSE